MEINKSPEVSETVAANDKFEIFHLLNDAQPCYSPVASNLLLKNFTY